MSNEVRKCPHCHKVFMYIGSDMCPFCKKNILQFFDNSKDIFGKDGIFNDIFGGFKK